MRPLELTIKGFTSFRDPQTIDFRAMDVFAISGPTGAGKSSILDAMTFALYGRIPRLGKHGCDEFISLGLDRMSTTLSFRVGDRELTVSRSLRRGKSAQAILEEGGRSLEDKVKKVDQHIELLLGLPYEAFAQAVVLPQGDFAKFLKAEPAKRTELLRELLRITIFVRMRQLASDKAATFKREVQIDSERLKQDYGHATPEAVAEIEKRLAACRGEIVGDRVRLDLRRSEANARRILLDKTTALDGARETRRLLDKRKPAVDELRVEFDAASRALELDPVLRDLSTTAKDYDETLTACTALESKQRSADQELAHASDVRNRAQNDAKEIPTLRKRVRDLDELKGDLEVLATEGEALTSASRERKRLAGELSAGEGRMNTLGGDRKSAQKAVDDASAVLKTADYDADQAERLESLRKDAVRIGALRAELIAAEKDFSKREKVVVTRQRSLEQADERLALATEELGQVEVALRKVQERHDEAKRRDLASVLRDDLRAGDTCPVCDHVVERVPRSRKTKTADLERLELELEKAAKAARSAQTKLTQCEGEVASTKRSLAEAKDERKDAKQVVAAAEEALAVPVSRLERKTANWLRRTDVGAIESHVLAALDQMTVKRAAHDKAQRQLEAARRKLDAVRTEHEKIKLDVERQQGEARALDARVRQHEKVIGDARARVSAVTKHADPRRERSELAARIENVTASLSNAQELEKTKGAEVAKLRALLDDAAQRRQRAEAKVTQLRDEAVSKASEHGFATLDDARGALRPSDRRKELLQLIKTFDDQCRTINERIAVLGHELEGRRVTHDDVATDAAELRTLEEAHAARVKEEGSLTSQHVRLRADIDRSLALRAELTKKTGARDVYVRLTDDLGASEFQEFVMRETANELVARATERLLRLSGGRYSLSLDEEFVVLDHENAAQSRPASTLSGGETFLTSLALALELSEQVQRSAGAVRLDSLFIDEGFGTLDPETLDMATEAIESLQAGGRMVGVITHLESLTERLPARILVQKATTGSTIELRF